MAELSISAPVGQGGANRKSDAELIQKLLNKFPASSPLTENGSCGPPTVAAIHEFQSGFMARPDDRIDPGRTSFRRLVVLSEGKVRPSMWSNVPVFSQSTAALCWEACARMMWHWRNTGATREADYRRAAGAYLTKNSGLQEVQMDVFYRQLGMRHLHHPKGIHLLERLQVGPLIFTSISKQRGHAMAAVGFKRERYFGRGTYAVLNPCAVMSMDFDSNSPGSCTAGSVDLAFSTVDPELGAFVWFW